LIGRVLRRSRWALAIGLLLALSGCGLQPLPFWKAGFFWPDAYWRDGRYLLLAVDTEDEMALSFATGDRTGSINLVGPTVFSVGIDKRWVVAKRHPSLGYGKFNRTITEYYIVDRTGDRDLRGFHGPRTIGPLTQAEFERLARRVSLPSFATTFAHLEGQDTGDQ
jgi:hypothetical protein